MMKTVIVCVPGNTFSSNWLQCWDLLRDAAWKAYEFNIVLSNRYSCNIYYSRTMCLGGDVLKGANQKPWNKNLKYDYILWIDSDIGFIYRDLIHLVRQNKDIISGWYKMEDNVHSCVVETWDEVYFQKHGSFKFLIPEDIKKRTEPFKVSYVGMGFMLVKYGVFESLKYPWFKPRFHTIGNCKDFSMEDVSFCLDVKDAGFDVYVDPSVQVGHEKRMIL